MAERKPITIYGIKNCDTMKKARAWLAAHDVAYTFHDYKAVGIDRARLSAWVEAVGWEVLLNKAGTTFRNVLEEEKANLTKAKALALMVAHPSLIKRPVLDLGGGLLVGFRAAEYQREFGN